MDGFGDRTSHTPSRMTGRNGTSDCGNLRKVEVITGFGRRRRWHEGDKARIVAESLAEGANVCAVARRYGINPSQIYAWRRQFGDQGAENGCGAGFVPVVVGEPPVVVPAGPTGRIEVAIGGVVVRVDGVVDGATLDRVLDAVRRLA